MPGANFHENITSQTQIINVDATLWYCNMASFRENEGILVQICKIHISVTIQVTRFKFGTFPYLSSTNLCAKFYGFLETWVSDFYYLSLFDVEFPNNETLRITNFNFLFESSFFLFLAHFWFSHLTFIKFSIYSRLLYFNPC